MRRPSSAAALALTVALAGAFAPTAQALPRASAGNWFGELRSIWQVTFVSWLVGGASPRGRAPESEALAAGMCIDPNGKPVTCPVPPAAPLTDGGMCIDPSGRCVDH